MADPSVLRRRVLALVLCMIGFGSMGNVLLAKGKEVGAVSVSSARVLVETLLQVFGNGLI